MKIKSIDHIFDVATQLINYISKSQPETESIMIDGKSAMIEDIKYSIYSGNSMSPHMIENEIEDMGYIDRNDAWYEVEKTMSKDDILKEMGMYESMFNLTGDEKEWLLNMIDKQTEVGKWEYAERAYDKIK